MANQTVINFEVGDKVQVIRSKRTGIVEKVFSNGDYPVQVNLGYGDCYTFKPYELKHLKQKGANDELH